MEIRQTLWSLPFMAVFTTPFFLAEVRGYSKMYDTTAEGPGLWYNILQFPFFICFTDFCIYWIHRGLHHPLVYKHLHKPHHKWIMPTPYASHAFHPMDGFSQSVPYHVFPFIFPLQKFAYVILFVFINIWTVLIHDGEYISNSPVINGAACHTMHHLYFNYKLVSLSMVFVAIPLTFDLQLRTVHDPLGSPRRQLPQAQRGIVQERDQDEQRRVEQAAKGDGESRQRSRRRGRSDIFA